LERGGVRFHVWVLSKKHPHGGWVEGGKARAAGRATCRQGCERFGGGGGQKGKLLKTQGGLRDWLVVRQDEGREKANGVKVQKEKGGPSI